MSETAQRTVEAAGRPAQPEAPDLGGALFALAALALAWFALPMDFYAEWNRGARLLMQLLLFAPLLLCALQLATLWRPLRELYWGVLLLALPVAGIGGVLAVGLFAVAIWEGGMGNSQTALVIGGHALASFAWAVRALIRDRRRAPASGSGSNQ